jgi:hypothetical protein
MILSMVAKLQIIHKDDQNEKKSHQNPFGVS